MEGLYTVEDVAAIAGVTTRTVRNYLKNGTLTGRKVGGQWRFTQADVLALFRTPGFGEDAASRHQAVAAFLAGAHGEETRVCALFDVPYRQSGGTDALREKVMAFAAAHPGAALEHHDLPTQKKLRFFLVASPEEVAALCAVIRGEEA